MIASLLSSKSVSDHVAGYILLSHIQKRRDLVEVTPIILMNSIMQHLATKRDLTTMRLALRTVSNMVAMQQSDEASLISQQAIDPLSSIAFDKDMPSSITALALGTLARCPLELIDKNWITYVHGMIHTSGVVSSYQWPFLLPALRFIEKAAEVDIELTRPMFTSLIALTQCFINRRIPQDRLYHSVVPPWLMATAFRVITVVAPPTPTSEQLRILQETAIQMLRDKFETRYRMGSTTKKDVNYSNSRAAAMLEAVSLVIATPALRHTDELLLQCVVKVTHLIQPEQCPRSKYIGLMWLLEAAAIPLARKKIAESFDGVAELAASADDAVRGVAIRLLCSVSPKHRTAEVVEAVLPAALTDGDAVTARLLYLVHRTLSGSMLFAEQAFKILVHCTVAQDWYKTARLCDEISKEERPDVLQLAWKLLEEEEADAPAARCLALYLIGKWTQVYVEDEQLNLIIDSVYRPQPVANVALTALSRLACDDRAIERLLADEVDRCVDSEVCDRLVQLHAMLDLGIRPAEFLSVPRFEQTELSTSIETTGRVRMIATPAGTDKLPTSTPSVLCKLPDPAISPIAEGVEEDLLAAFGPAITDDIPENAGLMDETFDLTAVVAVSNSPEEPATVAQPKISIRDVMRRGEGLIWSEAESSMVMTSQQISTTQIMVTLDLEVAHPVCNFYAAVSVPESTWARVKVGRQFPFSFEAHASAEYVLDLSDEPHNTDPPPICKMSGDGLGAGITVVVPISIASFMRPSDSVEKIPQSELKSRTITKFLTVDEAMKRLPPGFTVVGEDNPMVTGQFRVRTTEWKTVISSVDGETTIVVGGAGDYVEVLINRLVAFIEAA
ncbi:Adaptor Protein Complex 2 subunit, alpha (AP2A2) [Carpediemonas membranifera]|uniref:Adaptor Protein Complex 2 subunit, alpha (AP2A2) n=1 Tax=Carpediemonas membranifera TaxID=201153 RepID=A0A8J6E4A0_9EUKA|nr:Adaptor Protein Complex 2 subunit, alpha (AP2A2) [Carpediemonas membranifera]|eukprot:KAG9394192.1 Adaptor Protein Complex 2 subunit, alpha (AP2A2) [Carpediemonas membranifera]